LLSNIFTQTEFSS